jgi:hypothetical protein
MGLIWVGFFRELPHGKPTGPSLREHLQESGHPDEAAIVHYLNAGTTLAATGSMVDDYLDDTKKGVAHLEIATDGSWVWPRDLAYYVGAYHVRLPPEFVEHMRSNGWKAPEFTQADMERLETEFLASE